MFNRQTAPPVHRIDDTGLTPQSGARQRVPLEEQHMPPLNSRGQQAASVAAPSAPVSHPVPAPEEEPNVVTFSRAYENFGEMVTRVKFRAPKGREIKIAGTPLRVETDARGVINDIDYRWKAIAEYIHLLSEPQLLPSTVDRLEFEDMSACAEVIRDFFLMTRPS